MKKTKEVCSVIGVFILKVLLEVLKETTPPFVNVSACNTEFKRDWKIVEDISTVDVEHETVSNPRDVLPIHDDKPSTTNNVEHCEQMSLVEIRRMLSQFHQFGKVKASILFNGLNCY